MGGSHENGRRERVLFFIVRRYIFKKEATICVGLQKKKL
jgi:hypothetical protein